MSRKRQGPKSGGMRGIRTGQWFDNLTWFWHDFDYNYEGIFVIYFTFSDQVFQWMLQHQTNSPCLATFVVRILSLMRGLSTNGRNKPEGRRDTSFVTPTIRTRRFRVRAVQPAMFRSVLVLLIRLRLRVAILSHSTGSDSSSFFFF